MHAWQGPFDHPLSRLDPNLVFRGMLSHSIFIRQCHSTFDFLSVQFSVDHIRSIMRVHGINLWRQTLIPTIYMSALQTPQMRSRSAFAEMIEFVVGLRINGPHHTVVGAHVFDQVLSLCVFCGAVAHCRKQLFMLQQNNYWRGTWHSAFAIGELDQLDDCTQQGKHSNSMFCPRCSNSAS